jgi:stress response protein SCP2
MDFGVKNNIKPAFSFTSSSQNDNQTNTNENHLEQMNQQQMGQPQMSQPQMSQPQMSQPQMNQPQMNQPQMSQPQMSQPQMSQPQMSQPQMNQPQMSQPQMSQPQMSQPQMSQPQMSQPQMSQPQTGSGSVGVSLKKGQKVSLTKFNNNLDNILVGLGWDTAQNSSIPYDLDVEVFMLGANDKVVGDDWFVFYNKLTSPDGSVRHSGDNRTGVGDGDDETVMVQLSRVSPEVQKLVFVVTIDDALARGHNFGQISNAYIRIVDQSSNRELIRYNLTEYYPNVISMVVGEIYRYNDEWKFNPVGDGTSDDLMGLCLRYGVRVQ